MRQRLSSKNPKRCNVVARPVRFALSVTALLSCLLLPHPIRADAPSNQSLSAAEILARASKAENISSAPNDTSAIEYTISKGGLTEIQTVLTKAPDRILIKDQIAWMHLTRYLGYDGQNAWISFEPAGSGLAAPSLRTYILSLAAYYNRSSMVKHRWPTETTRLPDVTIKGKTYFAIFEQPKGATPDTLLIDQTTFRIVGGIFDPGHYDLCLRFSETNGDRYCALQAHFHGDEQTGSITTRVLDAHAVEDMQFSHATDETDTTTDWIIAHARAAVRAGDRPQAFALQGAELIGRYDNGPETTADWTLTTHPATGFSIDRLFGNKSDKLRKGDSHFYDGRPVGTDPAEFDKRLYGLAYNRCELYAVACHVSVARIQNARLDGNLVYTLKVTSTDPGGGWYVIFLDQSDLLPREVLFPNGVTVQYDGYHPEANGIPIPGTIKYGSLKTYELITAIRPGE